MEQSSLSVRQILDRLDIRRSAFITGLVGLSTVLGDHSRFIVSWRLCSLMSSGDVRDTLSGAPNVTGLDKVRVRYEPRLLSNNGLVMFQESSLNI